MDAKVVFLHIPKTAGQSVHAALLDAFDTDEICPARVNDQLCVLSIAELNRYSVFSGHLDWSALDCVKGQKFVFTVLREPLDRILSFYFFLRDKGSELTTEQRNAPENTGLKAAFELSPNEYFLGGKPYLRRFIDNHFDNFYTYFFAGRTYNSRENLLGLCNRGQLSSSEIVSIALDNMSSIDRIFSVDEMDTVFLMIESLGGRNAGRSIEYRVNVNKNYPAVDRLSRLKELGANAATILRLDEYCEMDNELWKAYF